MSDTDASVAPGALIAKGEELVVDYWLLLVLAGTGAIQLAAVVREFAAPGRPVLNTDAALYEHGGWYMAHGGVPYVDMWDVKPPLAFEIPAVFSVVTGGNPMAMHVLTVLATGGAAVAIAALAGHLVTTLTGDEWAGLVTGGLFVTFPFFFRYPATGFRPKTYVLLFGLLAIWVGLRGRPFASGLLAAASPGLWQLGVIFVLVSLGIAYRERGTEGAARAVAGMAVTTVLVVAPVVLAGGTQAMLVEAVLIPLQDAENQPLVLALFKGIFLLGFAVALVAVGVYGALSKGWERRETRWWILACTGWFLLQLYVDMDYFPDLFPLFVFAAIGLGLLVADRPTRHKELLLGILGVVAVLNLFLMLGVLSPTGTYTPIGNAKTTTDAIPGVEHPESEPIPEKYGPYYDVDSQEYLNRLFWNAEPPEYCHYRFAQSERRWLQRTDRTYRDPCGVPPASVP